MIWYSAAGRRQDRRRRAEIEGEIARSRRTSAELLLLVEQVRSQVSDLNAAIDRYLDRSRERV